jgi:hypothetical protein
MYGAGPGLRVAAWYIHAGRYLSKRHSATLHRLSEWQGDNSDEWCDFRRFRPDGARIVITGWGTIASASLGPQPGKDARKSLLAEACAHLAEVPILTRETRDRWGVKKKQVRARGERMRLSNRSSRLR